MKGYMKAKFESKIQYQQQLHGWSSYKKVDLIMHRISPTNCLFCSRKKKGGSRDLWWSCIFIHLLKSGWHSKGRPHFVMPSLMNIALLFLKHIFFDFFVVQKFSRKGKTVHYALGPSYSLPKAGCWMHGGSGSLSFNKQRQYLFSITWHLFFMQILTP